MDINMNKDKIVLVVDDLFENLLILKKMLEKCGYKPITASSAKDALEMIRIKAPEIILLDVYMPEMDGFELCEILKRDVQTKDIPIVFISAGMSEQDKVRGFSLGAVDFINKPFSLEEVSLRVNNHVQMYAMRKHMQEYTRNLNKMVKDHAIKIKEEQHNTITALLKMFFLRYPDEEQSFRNVAYNCRFLAQTLEFSDNYEKQINATFIDTIGEAVMLHDVGKLAANSDESNNHEVRGGQYLKELSFLSEHNEMIKMAMEVAICHNEKWDGTGYPAGLKGEEIPLAARILAICNRFEKEYKNINKGNPDMDIEELREKAIAAVVKESGERFDPEMTKLFSQVSRQLSVKK